MDGEVLVFWTMIFPMCILLFFSVGVLAQNIDMKRRYGPEARCYGKVKYLSGLNLPSGMICKLVCFGDRLLLMANGQELTLSADKLIYVDILSKREITKQYVSNPGGAIAGAMLGGALGAVILGGPTKETLQTTRKNLVITYRNGETPVYILFDASYREGFVRKVMQQYKYLRKNPNLKIEL